MEFLDKGKPVLPLTQIMANTASRDKFPPRPLWIVLVCHVDAALGLRIAGIPKKKKHLFRHVVIFKSPWAREGHSGNVLYLYCSWLVMASPMASHGVPLRFVVVHVTPIASSIGYVGNAMAAS